MISTTSSIASTPRSNILRRFAVLMPIIDSVSIVLLPSLIALMISAACVGHGHISASVLREVFDMMAQAFTQPAMSP